MKNFKLVAFLLLVTLFTSCGQDSKKQVEQEQPADAQEVVSSQAPATEVADTTAAEELPAAMDSTAIAYVCPPCTCSMHDTTFSAPGVCPACHMALVKK